MKADWDRLGGVYSDHKNVMIVDVDCTADGKATCQKHGVKGYPTIQYFLAGKKRGQAYQGGRDFNSLKSFAAQTLDIDVVTCNPLTGDDCLEIEKRFIDANKDKSASELEALYQEKKQAKKDLRKEESDYKKEHRAKLKEFKKSQKKLEMAIDILKALKTAAPAEHDEL